jgi:hypothetical protein
MELLNCKQKAELTYKALQKRKAKKRRKREVEATEVHLKAVIRCKNLRNGK